MKTQTKLHILKIIRKKRSVRPSELAQTLKISPQIIHRHLKTLLADRIIEKKGTPPYTRYMIAGMPDFSKALKWFFSQTAPDEASEVCETRDVFSARLSHFVPLEKRGLLKADISLVVSVSGEIGNNSFDHNLGQWKDVPGCWFEINVTHGKLWILIADRGQGIYRSISQVAVDVENDQSAIELAFSKRISGRAFEKRGNGLKYVKNVIINGSSRGLACRSGNGLITLGDFGQDCTRVLKNIPDANIGTITLIAWVLHENNG